MRTLWQATRCALNQFTIILQSYRMIYTWIFFFYLKLTEPCWLYSPAGSGCAWPAAGSEGSAAESSQNLNPPAPSSAQPSSSGSMHPCSGGKNNKKYFTNSALNTCGKACSTLYKCINHPYNEDNILSTFYKYCKNMCYRWIYATNQRNN